MQQLGGPDLAQLQATMRAIELACDSIQMHVNPAAAEATILSLSQSPHPYRTCQYIMENSLLAIARFQAAGAIRDAAIREWAHLTADVKIGLISFSLGFLMQHANSAEGYVQAKVASVAAQLLKRGWLEFTIAEKEVFFLEVKKAITSSHVLDVQYAGINFLESLVSEFTPSTSSAMSLPREFHERCRMSLELDFLKIFYCWAKDAAEGVTMKINESNSVVPEAKVCTAALRLMFQILNWDFRCNKSTSEGGRKGIDVFTDAVKQDNNSTRRVESNLVQPGASWRDVLISSGHAGWLLSLYGSLRHKFSREGYWLDCPIAVSARKLIVQFCSLTGSIFPSDNGHMQGQHLLQLLSGILPWIDPPDAVSQAIECGRSESEMLDGCRALFAIATVTTPVLFDQLLKSMRPYGTLSLLSALMCEAIKDRMTTTCSEEDTWSWVARDILLDTWTVLLMSLETIGNNTFPPEGISAAANLFMLIVEAELAAASASASSDETECDNLQASIAAMDERLSSYALIARAAIDTSLPFLIRLFSERFARLHEGRGTSNIVETLEELYSLLLITGHVLADETPGEVPLVPNSIQTKFLDKMEPDKHPVVLLSGSIIKFAEQSLNPEMRESFFSPRLMEAVVWFLSRWSSTYLMAPEDVNPSYSHTEAYLQLQHSTNILLYVFGEKSQGKAILEIFIRISMAILVSYPGEKDLRDLTCFQLLHGLVRRRNICSQLVSLEPWHQLATAFANERSLLSLNSTHQLAIKAMEILPSNLKITPICPLSLCSELPSFSSKAKRSLAQTLVLSASGMKNSEASNQYVRDLTSHMSSYIVELSGKNDLKNVAQQPDIIWLVTCLMERLRGVACASEPRMQKSIYEVGFSVINSLLTLLEVYKNESAVVYLLLKFISDWVDGQIIYLEARETAVVVDFCMRLLKLYSSHNIGKISLSSSSSLRAEADTEKYKDLRALLLLLSSLCSKDLVDFSSEPIESYGTNISQVVYMGLHIVTPLISLELLKYPKLCHDYFSLLSHMLEVYPEMIAQLNNEALDRIVGTLDFGLHHQDVEVVDFCLRALKALASYHYKEKCAAKLGLGSYASNYSGSSGNNQEGILIRFLRSLLQILLFEDYSTDLVSSAADALLPLILCEQDQYQRLGNELIERQANLEFRSRLMNALRSLTSSNNLSFSLDRQNYQKFRKNLHNFLSEVRGFLRTI